MEGSCEYILNKQSQIAARGGPPAWGLGVGLTTHHKNKLVTKIHKPRAWTDFFKSNRQHIHGNSTMGYCLRLIT
jgi:hypothetical protein